MQENQGKTDCVHENDEFSLQWGKYFYLNLSGECPVSFFDLNQNETISISVIRSTCDTP